MAVEITDHESDAKVEKEMDNAHLMFKSFDILIKELSPKVEGHQLIDGFLTVGLDMLRHMFEHAMPDASEEELGEKFREHVLNMIAHLEDGPWTSEE
jgi:Mg2+ and Co2+ transporter CorA